MRRYLVSVGILALLVGSARAADPVSGSNSDQTPPNSRPTAPEALAPGDYVGRLVKVNATGNNLVLQITKHRQILKNPDGPTRTFDEMSQDIDKDIAKIGKLYTDSVISHSQADLRRMQERDKEVAAYQKALPKTMQKLQQQQENPQPVEYVTLTEHKDLPLAAAKEVKVRLRELPAFDADGYVIKYTSEEIRAAKGKQPFEPGFDGKLKNLTAGQYVRLTVVPKAIGKTEPKPGDSLAEVTEIIVLTKDQAEKAIAARP